MIYPTSAENELFSANDPKTLTNIENIKAQLAKNGTIYGDFRDFYFEQKYFFDTSYHLNKEGVILRTQKFIEFLINLDEIYLMLLRNFASVASKVVVIHTLKAVKFAILRSVD